jgi:radical SAM superfamily enzyme YgiQ (UPF0313 family)
LEIHLKMSPLRALLIYPEFPDTFWGFKHALKFIRKKAALPPLGLLTLGAMLPKEWSKRLIDINVRKLTDKDLEWADLVFISGMVVQRESARQTIARCKKTGLKVVAGGPLFTSEYEQFEEVDHFVLNEAELTLPPFLADLEQGCPKRIYKASRFCDIRETPVPMWELADLKRYASMNIQVSRSWPCPPHLSSLLSPPSCYSLFRWKRESYAYSSPLVRSITHLVWPVPVVISAAGNGFQQP